MRIFKKILVPTWTVILKCIKCGKKEIFYCDKYKTIASHFENGWYVHNTKLCSSCVYEALIDTNQSNKNIFKQFITEKEQSNFLDEYVKNLKFGKCSLHSSVKTASLK